MPAQVADNFWPGPLRHCARPLVSDVDQEIIIGEVSSEPIDGFAGNRMLYTALVPLGEVDWVLNAPGGLGHGVTANARHPALGAGGEYWPAFSVYAPDGSKRYESLIHTWDNHNQRVFLPDTTLLMCYGLVPRTMKDGSISWDDLFRPVYDVVRVTPLSNYSVEQGFTRARVTIQRDYLEDYLSLKECAAIATYFDERFSLDNPEVAPLIVSQEASFRQRGRELWFLPMRLDSANQVSQVWGCALVLSPRGRPISDPPEVELSWPDRLAPIKGSGIEASFEPLETAYVRDEVLRAYEMREEFEISPEAGFVGYGRRWSVSYCNRVGRNHIELELRKLYEGGAPFEVIKHFQSFAVKATVAEADTQIYGKRHIGNRAKELI